MDIRLVAAAAVLMVAVPAAAQVHSASGPKAKPTPIAPKAAHNSMAKSTTPFECERHRWPKHPHPGMKPYCDQVEATVLQDEARRAGRPEPSSDVISLPPMGTEAAKQTGRACIGGQAMRKLASGWAQEASKAGGWQRCRERL